VLKILLVDADHSWVCRVKHLPELEVIHPPVGLLYIASYLREKFQGSLKIKVLCRMVDCPEDEEFLAILRDFDPDIVGIRGMIIHKEVFHQTAAQAKLFNDKIIVIGGGPYPSFEREVINDPHIDYIVVGEGEATFGELLEKLISGQKPLKVQGLIYKDGQAPVVNPPRPFITDLDSLPFPDYSLIDESKYTKFLNWSYSRRKQRLLFSSRGCPYQCIYCHALFGKRFRARSPQNVFDEILAGVNDGVKDFYFIDDTFNLDYRRAMDIFELIINSGLKINLYFSNGLRGDIMDKPFIDKMVQAGTIWVTYAVETGSPRVQKYIKKYINLEKLADNIHYTCQKEIMVNYFFMMGFPTETQEEALQTLEYIKQFKKAVIPFFHAVKYYPGTELCRLAIQEGFDEKSMRTAYTDPFHGIIHSGTPLIPKQVFQEIVFKFLNEIFLSKERLLNAIKIQRRFLANQEILDTYSTFFRKHITDFEKEVMPYAK